VPTLARPDAPLTDGIVALRPFALDDVPAVTAACQDPEIARWTASIPSPYEEEHARSWIATHDSLWDQGEAAEFAVTAASDGHLLGSFGLRPLDWAHRTAGAGYWVVASERGQGVATRGLRLGAGWAHKVGLVTVELVTMIGNRASERVAEKSGFHVVEEIEDYEHTMAPDQHYHVKRWLLRGGVG